MIDKANDFDLKVKWCFPEGRKYLFVFFALFACLAITYGNSLQGTWVFDDEPGILQNRSVHLTALNWENVQKTFYGIEQKRITRPIAYLSFGINYYFGRLDPLGYHIVNLLIFYLTAIVLFLFLHRTLNLPRLQGEYGASSYSIALLATFLWAINPLQVTAVTYIVQRMASMAGLWYIASMFFYLRGRTSERAGKKIAFFFLSGGAALLAFGTKENTFLLPLAIYLYDLFLIQGIDKATLIKHLKYALPLMLAACAAALLWVDLPSLLSLDHYAIRPFTMGERLLTETRVVLFYASLLFYPLYSRLMLNHDFTISTSLFTPWTTLPAPLAILGLLGLAIAWARKKPLLSYCIVFFFLNHAIEGSVIPLELVFEHTNYTPSLLFFVPFSLGVIQALHYFSSRVFLQALIALSVSVVLIAQGHTVQMYNFLFRDPYILWSDNVAKAPNLSRPLNNLGNILWNWGLHEDAYDAYEKSFQRNRYAVMPMIAAPINNMGRYHFYKKDYAAAMEHFQTALKINPKYPLTWINIARTHIRLADFGNAERTVREALAHWPENAWLRSILSFVLLKEGNYRESAREAWKAAALDGEGTDVSRVLAALDQRAGRDGRAALFWEAYAAQYTDEVEPHLALLELYANRGDAAKLHKTIARIMVLKGGKSWSSLIDEYEAEQAAHAYLPDRKRLLSLIRESLR